PHALRLLESLLVNRRQIRTAWWALLGTVGLTERRWHSFPAWERRAIKLAVVGLLAAVIFGPLYGFAGQPRSRGAAYVMFAVLALLYVPSWSRYRLPLVPGAPRARVPRQFVLPLAVLAVV